MNSDAYGFKVEFTVPIRPVGKARPRFTRFGHAYTPDTTRAAEHHVAFYATAMMQGHKRAESQPLAVDLEFVFAPPASWSKKKREEAIRFCKPRKEKPDIDNLGKLVCDALNGIVYADDNQITELRAVKYYGEHDEIKVCVREI